MSTEGGTKAVVAALVANGGIGVSKLVAFFITGSSSMLAESIHSFADCGNQGLLLYGGKAAKRPADEVHPFGYGRARYFFAFVVALVLFSLGGLFALYEGYHKIRDPHEIDSAAVAIGVLVVAMVLEGLSLRTAVRESRHAKGTKGWVAFVRTSRSPELPVILLEDLGALIGLALALLGVGLALATGNGVWDGVGTLAIGALLVCIAIALAVETKGMLFGEGAVPESVARVRAALTATSGVTEVLELRTLHLGPDDVLVVARLRLAEQRHDVEELLNAAADRVREVEPLATQIFLEPDLGVPSVLAPS